MGQMAAIRWRLRVAVTERSVERARAAYAVDASGRRAMSLIICRAVRAALLSVKAACAAWLRASVLMLRYAIIARHH